jgi:hypothetical protein
MTRRKQDTTAPIIGTPDNGLKWVEYVGLEELLSSKWEKNPKDHDIGEIDGSINQWGFRGALLFDERSRRLVAGHGRLETLEQKKERGEDPPAGMVERGGEWYIPVLRGERFDSDADVEAYIVADNRLVEKGGWLDDLLLEALQHVQEERGTLAGTGYDEDDLDELLRAAAAPEEPEEGGEGDGDGESEPADTQVQVGAYRYPVEREVYERWLEELRQDVGFDDEAIKEEIRRRLKL